MLWSAALRIHALAMVLIGLAVLWWMARMTHDDDSGVGSRHPDRGGDDFGHPDGIGVLYGRAALRQDRARDAAMIQEGANGRRRLTIWEGTVQRMGQRLDALERVRAVQRRLQTPGSRHGPRHHHLDAAA